MTTYVLQDYDYYCSRLNTLTINWKILSCEMIFSVYWQHTLFRKCPSHNSCSGVFICNSSHSISTKFKNFDGLSFLIKTKLFFHSDFVFFHLVGVYFFCHIFYKSLNKSSVVCSTWDLETTCVEICNIVSNGSTHK